MSITVSATDFGLYGRDLTDVLKSNTFALTRTPSDFGLYGGYPRKCANIFLHKRFKNFYIRVYGKRIYEYPPYTRTRVNTLMCVTPCNYLLIIIIIHIPLDYDTCKKGVFTPHSPENGLTTSHTRM